MYAYESIREVHLEITDKCNAACPQCSRNDHGGAVNPRLPLTELTFRDVREILDPEFLSQLRTLYACGNYGDPIVARDCLDIFRYIRNCSPNMRLGIHTNGGARSIDFWRQLGSLLPKGKGYVRFGIDGLEETNHVYRRNVRWPTLMRNVMAFIEAGGNAEWDYLVFRHNEHQVEEARQMAKNLGFTLFNVKKTRRFLDDKNMKYIDSTPIKDQQGIIVGNLERPTEPNHQNEALEGLKVLERRHGSMDRYLDHAVIRCKVQEKKSIYVSAEGYVLPCCWLASQMHHRAASVRAEILDLLGKRGGAEHIDGKRRSIRAIVEDDFFRTLVPSSWTRPSCSQGKLRTCARVCGNEFQQYEAQSALNRRPGPATRERSG